MRYFFDVDIASEFFKQVEAENADEALCKIHEYIKEKYGTAWTKININLQAVNELRAAVKSIENLFGKKA